jgi:hypothetical protein
MKNKVDSGARTKHNKVYQHFRFYPRDAAILATVAKQLRRTKTSILEQLITEFCTTKNLQ